MARVMTAAYVRPVVRAIVALALALVPATVHAQGYGSSSGSVTANLIYIVLFLVLLLVCIGIFIVPSVIAFRRQHPNRWVILVINLAFGGTIIGWFGALIWALGVVHQSATGNNGGESGLNLFVNDPKTVRVEPQTNAPASTTPPVDPAERLAQLKRLFDAGAISAEEHTTLRRSVLDAWVG